MLGYKYERSTCHLNIAHCRCYWIEREPLWTAQQGNPHSCLFQARWSGIARKGSHPVSCEPKATLPFVFFPWLPAPTVSKHSLHSDAQVIQVEAWRRGGGGGNSIIIAQLSPVSVHGMIASHVACCFLLPPQHKRGKTSFYDTLGLREH